MARGLPGARREGWEAFIPAHRIQSSARSRSKHLNGVAPRGGLLRCRRPAARGGIPVATTSEKRKTFRRMHESGCFVLPNPWDVGSVRYLQGLGFKALASTSSGAAWSLGAPDNGITLEQAIAHVAALVAVTDLPVDADFEHGFADDPEGVARHVARCLATGVAALSIEDSTGEQTGPLYELSRAVERIQAARAAVDEAGQGAGHGAGEKALLVGRA